MKPYIATGLSIALVLGATALLCACSDEQDGTTTETQPLSEQMDATGLPPGSWAVSAASSVICSRNIQYPGGSIVTEDVELSGFEAFELRVNDEDESVAVRGRFDELSARWTNSCVEFDRSRDTISNHSACEGLGECTPFNVLRVCGNNGSPSVFAEADCGHRQFDAVRQ